jgi:hypothetical protein
MRKLRRLRRRLPCGSNRRITVLSGATARLVTSCNKPCLFFNYQKKRKSSLFFLFFSLFAALNFPLSAAESSPLPAIVRLDSRDTTFKQYMEDVEAARRVLFSYRESLPDRAAMEKVTPFLTIYAYIPKENDDLLGIAARCSIPYSALVSLNRFSHGDDMAPGKAVLLPSLHGIFVPEKPDTHLERLLSSTRAEGVEASSILLSVPRGGTTERFRFIPGDDFNATERIFFLNRGFHFPLERFEVSSSYGPRINPVTGKAGMHGGLDLAAPEGTNVYAARDGIVMDTGEDPVLGKYVIISHENNWVSLYGHLSAVVTSLRAELRSGNLIARVGSTGQSTGPHLHFELKQNGRSRDPARLLGIFGGNTGR